MDSLASTEVLGYVAATLTTVSFIPQALHTFRTRSAAGISVGMYSLFTVGVALWLVYGVALSSWPMIAANGITFILAAIILALALRSRPKSGIVPGLPATDPAVGSSA
jgi:MtN3 and saliva related transmembrane protein